jgi:predicted CXXCH cytochrome family protein
VEAQPKQVASEAAKLQETEKLRIANRRNAMRRLNRILVTTAAIVVLVGLPVAAWAGISGTAHDLSASAGGGQICVVCHTPHNAIEPTAGPLWDHTLTAVTDYGAYTSDTLTATDVDGDPGSTSLLCLSCHDGTVAVDAFGGAAGSGNIGTGAANLGTDLTDDHPIGFTYSTTLATTDGGLIDPTTLTDIELFGASDDQLECASCHEVHDNANSPFLRVSNTTPASGLCLTCHIK